MSFFSLSLFLSHSRFRRIRFTEFHYRTSLRLSQFSGTSQITEIKEARTSLEDTPTSLARASRSLIVRTLNCATKRLLARTVAHLSSNMIGYSRNQSLDDSTKARAESIRRDFVRSSRPFPRGAA